MLLQRTDGRTALFSTISRLFEGLSDIAKAVMIILIADTMLGYHSEEVRSLAGAVGAGVLGWGLLGWGRPGDVWGGWGRQGWLGTARGGA